MAPYAQHAEELSRAISEINLNTVRQLATDPRIHDTDLQNHNYENGNENHGPGLATPDIPGAPPPTPVTPGHNLRAKDDSTTISPLKELDENTIAQPIEDQDVKPLAASPSSVSVATLGEQGNATINSEPDEATKIRRQVEYYFSDANLPSDVFLQKKTEGKNKPVKVEMIAGFGRMRQFRPYSSIVAALKDSVSLEISGPEGEETIKRKKPYDPENPLTREETYTDIGKYPKAFDEDSFAPKPVAPAGEKGSKKKKRSSGANKVKRPPPTGFEEFYADAPLTPGEAIDEMNDFYSPDRPFHERMESCIQNYRAKRKLDERKANIFTQYLILGGIEASNKKQFTGGLDKNALEESTAREIKNIQATDFIRGSTSSKYYDPNNSEHWVVDFSGVVAGFFSYTFPNYIGYGSTVEIRLACGVIKNFLNYILHHSVCPEYTEDIMDARRICDKAEEELSILPDLRRKLPGDYNMASSTLWGGEYKNAYIEPTPEGEDGFQLGQYGMHPKDAERHFNVCIGLTGTQDQYLAVMRSQPKVLKCEQRGYEVVDIERATIQTIEQYAGIKDRHGKVGQSKPLGFLKVKPWEGPYVEPEDSTDDGIASPLSTDIETFWIDDDILQHCFIGFKFVCTVHELEFGIRYFDSIVGAYCSFFTYLENEKMRHWKAPVLNTRPPPTEDEPEVEETEMNDFGEL